MAIPSIPMLVLAHRGCHKTEPENTLAAFEAAVALGADGIETDIRLCAEGLPILFHDRLAGGAPVAELSRTELARLVGYPIPTLEEALAKFPDILWNLEIKAPAALDATLDVLASFAETHRILISSFWHELVVAACGRLAVDGAFLIAHSPPAGSRFRTWLPENPRCHTVVWHWETCTREHVAAAGAEGIASFVYDLETAAEFADFAAWGGRGVITDRPELFVRMPTET